MSTRIPTLRTERAERTISTARPRLMASVAALTVGAALAVAAPASASAGPAASGSSSSTLAVPLGSGYAGIGYLADGKSPKPDTARVPSADAVTPALTSWGPAGVDVSHYQGTINWSSVKAAGISFAYIKATEGTTYTDPQFSANYLHAYNAKVIRGAYHFAQPSLSSGATQAAFFASHGGAWSADNLTLPGMLDLEGGCAGLSQSSMRSWIMSFYNTYKSKTTRDVVIYTSPSWWNTCTGGWSGMSTLSPLYVADWTTASNPTIPSGFPYATIWQYTDSGSVSGISGAVDRDRFNGTSTRHEEHGDRARREQRYAVPLLPRHDEREHDADARQARNRQLAEEVQSRVQDEPPALDQRRVGHEPAIIFPAPEVHRADEHDGHDRRQRRASPHDDRGGEEQHHVALGPRHRRRSSQEHRRPVTPFLEEVGAGDDRQRRLHRLHARLRPHHERRVRRRQPARELLRADITTALAHERGDDRDDADERRRARELAEREQRHVQPRQRDEQHRPQKARESFDGRIADVVDEPVPLRRVGRVAILDIRVVLDVADEQQLHREREQVRRPRV